MLKDNDFKSSAYIYIFDMYKDLNSHDYIKFPNHDKNTIFKTYIPLFPSQMNAVYSLLDESTKSYYKGYLDEAFIAFIGRVFKNRAVFLLSDLTILFLTLIIIDVSYTEKEMINNFIIYYGQNNEYNKYRYYTQDISNKYMPYIPTKIDLHKNRYKLKQEKSTIIFNYV